MKCKTIALAVNLLKLNKWHIKEEYTGWSEMNLVIYFEQRLTEKMRSELKKIGGLEYHLCDDDAHYAKEEVFICTKCKVSIAFPVG